MLPEHDRGRPGEETASKMSVAGDGSILQSTGCLCGHLADYECKRHEPIPTPKGCGGCQALSSEQIAYCSRRQYFCSENSCAWASLNADLGRAS